jgi:hypothetical protein
MQWREKIDTSQKVTVAKIKPDRDMKTMAAEKQQRHIWKKS